MLIGRLCRIIVLIVSRLLDDGGVFSSSQAAQLVQRCVFKLGVILRRPEALSLVDLPDEFVRGFEQIVSGTMNTRS